VLSSGKSRPYDAALLRVDSLDYAARVLKFRYGLSGAADQVPASPTAASTTERMAAAGDEG
jgi:hypothetical protein